MEYSNVFVCLMGMGTTFVVLICIIILCKLMSLVAGSKSAGASAPVAAAPAAVAQEIPNKQALVAGICAVIAEELGTDVKNLRVLSFKKVS